MVMVKVMVVTTVVVMMLTMMMKGEQTLASGDDVDGGYGDGNDINDDLGGANTCYRVINGDCKL